MKECCAVSRSPAGFLTPAQLLRLRNESFFRKQSDLKSSLSVVFLKPSYSYLQQYSAVVGFTTSGSQALILPWIVVSEQDPLARPALVSILGRNSGVGEEGVSLLDRLDLTEVIGDWVASNKSEHSSKPSQGSVCLGSSSNFGPALTVSTTVSSNHSYLGSTGVADSVLFTGSANPRSSTGNQGFTGMGSSSLVAVDMAVSSLLQDTERLSHLALSSVQTLFQPLSPIPIPQSSTSVKEEVPSLDTVPIPFQRVCLLLRQHFYWISGSKLEQLPWQQIENNDNDLCVVRSCTIGPQSGVKCVGVSRFPLERLLRWYQTINFFRQLHLQLEPANSDIHRLLTDILTLT